MSSERLTQLPSPQPEFPDGQFLVRRSDGSVEQGWSVEREYTAQLENGEQVPVAVLTKPDHDSGGTLAKTIPIERLRSWQVTDAEGSPHGNAENIRNPRLERIFAPLQRPEVGVERPGYEHLFSDDPVLKQRADDYNAAVDAVQPEQARYDRYVNESTRERAAGALDRILATDSKLRGIIESFAGRVNPGDRLAVVDALRTDPELRYKAGTYFLEKVNRAASEHPDLMPERIMRNTEKSVSGLVVLAGLSKVLSREYVALLCLAKIDGSFNTEKEAGDGIEYGADNRVELGQHRAATDIVLYEAA